MSVRTSADAKLEAAREHVQLGLESLSAVVVLRVSGTESLRNEFMAELVEVHAQLISVRNKLDPHRKGP